jgi:uncharacterized protein (TIGR00251 family)
VPPEALLTVQVRPRAAQDAVAGWVGAALRVRVTAPPAGGAANEAVRTLLARALGCPRAAVEIVRGAAARTKLVRVAGLSSDEARGRLGAARPAPGRESASAERAPAARAR